MLDQAHGADEGIANGSVTSDRPSNPLGIVGTLRLPKRHDFNW